LERCGVDAKPSQEAITICSSVRELEALQDTKKGAILIAVFENR